MRIRNLGSIILILLLVATVGLLSCRNAQAKLWDKRDNPNLDVIYLENPRVDMALRVKLISEAKHSVETISFSQTTDEVGGAVIGALRTALKNGRNVRSMFDSSGNMAEGDSRIHATRLLADSSLPCPGEVICATPYQKLRNGLSIDDLLHPKITIIDRGTPSEVIILGGRNYGKAALSWGDSAAILRRVDPAQPWAGEDLREAYDRLWNNVHDIFPKTPVRPVPVSLAESVDRTEAQDLLQTSAQRRQFNQIVSLLEKSPAPGDQLAKFQFRPKAFQLSTNDLFQSIREQRPGYTVNSRKGLQNDTIDLLHSYLTNAQSARLTGYGVGLPDVLHDDMMQMVGRGGSLKIFTNGREALREAANKQWQKPILGSALDYTLRDVIPLLEQGTKTGGNVEAYFLDLHKPSARRQNFSGWNTTRTADDGFTYLHRKNLSIDSRYVGLGSDNLTISSTRKNEEVYAIFDDHRMASFLERQTDTEAAAFFTPMTLREAKHEFSQRPLYSDCMQWLLEQIF